MRIAVVGVWHVHADEYVEELLEERGVEVIGVFDEDRARAAAFASRHGLPVIDAFAETLGSGVDAILVCAETTAHARIITAALQADKHVFTEKVLTPDLDSALALERLAAERQRVLLVSLQRLAEPWLYSMLDVIRSGVIGTVTATRLRYQHGGVVEGWLPDGFLDPGEAAGGSVIDLGAHGYYLSLMLHGSFPASISASAQAYSGHAVEDHSVVVLSYPDGAVSTLETSLVAGPYARWCEVYGTKGFAVVDSRDDLVSVRTEGTGWVARENGPRRATPIRRFLDAVAAGRADTDNVRAALRLTGLVEATYRALADRRAVGTEDPARDAG
ncbi:MAG: Gfo/Idh/MocA family oxidoreductase [Microbacterium sp.]